MSVLRRFKDVAIEKALVRFARREIERYGELKTLKINTAKKLLSGEVHLLGDEVPLIISQARYRFEQNGERVIALVYDVLVSKPWLQNLVEDHFNEIRIEVPASISKVVKHLL